MSEVLHRVRFRWDHRWAPPHMSDYLDAELGSRGRRRMERHVGECHECGRLLASLRAMLGRLQGLQAPRGDVEGAALVAESVRLRLADRSEQR